MNKYVTPFVEAVRRWDGIEAHPHRFGGTEFKIGKVEIGHIHKQNGMLDIPYTVKIREALVAEGETALHHLLQESGWTTFFIRSEADLNQALRLMRLSYLQKRSRRTAVKPTEIDSLRFSPAVTRAAFPRLAS